MSGRAKAIERLRARQARRREILSEKDWIDSLGSLELERLVRELNHVARVADAGRRARGAP